MNAWIEQETQDADFGDERLDARYRILLEQLSDHPSLSLPAACGGDAEVAAAYRFFDNEKTEPAKVLGPHRTATLERIRAEAVVIAAQDTTEVDLTRKKEKVGGPLNDSKRWGLYLHPVLVMTPQRVPLGVVEATMWSRDPKQLDKTSQERKKERRQKPFAQKESYRWLQGYEAACQIATLAPKTKVVCVSDSEGDIYECFLAGAGEEAKHDEQRAGVDRAFGPRRSHPGGRRKELASTAGLSGEPRDNDGPGQQAGSIDGRWPQASASAGEPQGKGDGQGGANAFEVAGSSGGKVAVGVCERDPGARGETARGRGTDRMASDHEPADRDVCGVLHGGELLLLPLGDRGVFPRAQERLQDRGIATATRRPDAGVPGDVSDCGVAGVVRTEDGPRISADGLRRDLHGSGMEVGVCDCEPEGSAVDAAHVGRDPAADRGPGRLPGPQAGWSAGPEDDVDRFTAAA